MEKSPPKKLTPIIAASSAGTLIEWYDFFLFGSLATIISTEFFPKENPTAAFLATLATFSAGLVVRPLGALFFGRLGDLTGRKHTFMLTLTIMGVTTVGMGLVPGYNSIGYFAPAIVLALRLLQGLALGGEYGGAAVYVAEHSPHHQRGFWTSWIQSTSGLAFILSITVILIIKSMMKADDWLNWGWRIPFIASVFLVGISIYIRNKLSETPAFSRAKSSGKLSANPLKESLGKKNNLKLVLLAFFGLTIGGGVIGWIGFYAQGFLLKTMKIDYDQANTIIIAGILLGAPFFYFFGWLSDKIGRKPLIILGMLLGVLAFRPVFKSMHQIADLNLKIEIGTGSNSAFQVNHQPDSKPPFRTVAYTDGTVKTEGAQTEFGEVPYTVQLSQANQWKLIFLVFILQFIFTMANGPLGAFMVEMFPVKIRYTSLSVPYHFGTGIFGGLAPYFATYLVSKAQESGRADYYLSGLTYPYILTVLSVVIGLVYVRENNRNHAWRLVPVAIINPLRKWLGVVWIVLAFATAWYGFFEKGFPKIFSGQQEDVIFGIIITLIITPFAAAGLFLFGKYALAGEYDE